MYWEGTGKTLGYTGGYWDPHPHMCLHTPQAGGTESSTTELENTWVPVGGHWEGLGCTRRQLGCTGREFGGIGSYWEALESLSRWLGPLSGSLDPTEMYWEGVWGVTGIYWEKLGVTGKEFGGTGSYWDPFPNTHIPFGAHWIQLGGTGVYWEGTWEITALYWEELGATGRGLGKTGSYWNVLGPSTFPHPLQGAPNSTGIL